MATARNPAATPPALSAQAERTLYALEAITAPEWEAIAALAERQRRGQLSHAAWQAAMARIIESIIRESDL